MRIFLIRHGFSEGNEDGDNYALRGDPNIQLTDTGWQQAIRAGAFLKDYCARHNIESPRLWTSPYTRTRETTSGLIHGGQGFFDKKTRVEESLIEMDFGDFSGYHTDEMRAQNMPWVAEAFKKARGHSRFFARPPRGESPFDVQRRAERFIDSLMRDIAEGEQNHGGITHGVTLRVLAMAFMHIDPAYYVDFPNPENCSIYVIEGDRHAGYSFKQIFNGETGQDVDINWGEILKAGEAVLPPVPQRFKIEPL